MYQLAIEKRGSFEVHHLTHKIHPQSIAFVPERGGCLLSARFEDQEVIDGYQTAEEIDFNRWGKSGVLYPFPNRLKDGHYHWNGQDYQFPINDSSLNNALHGFGMERPLEVVEIQLNENHACVRMQGYYDGGFDYYPWPFTFQLKYDLFAPDQLWMEMTITNEATESIPAGLGWHPYFQLGDVATDYELLLPNVEMVGIDQQMIPTGKHYPYDTFQQLRPIGQEILDNCFALSTQFAQATAIVRGTRGALRYWQETGPGKFNFLQAFTPPYGTSIALEPMTCNVDAFNNGEGLARLEPGASLKAKAGIQYFKTKNERS